MTFREKISDIFRMNLSMLTWIQIRNNTFFLITCAIFCQLSNICKGQLYPLYLDVNQNINNWEKDTQIGDNNLYVILGFPKYILTF